MEKEKSLVKAAIAARENAYAPYSGYTVGAAVLADNGCIYSGCNIENASYPAGICAERTAVFKAVSEGAKRIDAIALSAGKSGQQPEKHPSPCGICRQVMAEFGDGDMPVILAKSEEDYKIYSLSQLLPLSFTAEDL